MNIVDQSIKNKVEKFILISTDKAVKPTNIMGASKSICELYCQNIKSNNTKNNFSLIWKCPSRQDLLYQNFKNK